MTNWTSYTFTEYLNAVDDLLEATTGQLSEQRDLEDVAAAQEADDTPEACAEALSRRLRIRALNDALRALIAIPILCRKQDRIVLTDGIAALPVDTLKSVIFKVRDYDRFTSDNDPYGEHDFGNLVIDGLRIFWKIDYYDPTRRYRSEDPSDAQRTARVLTVLLADEY
jgi:hypothetical protein